MKLALHNSGGDVVVVVSFVVAALNECCSQVGWGRCECVLRLYR